MQKGDYFLVGTAAFPRGVAIVVNGITIVMGVQAARARAQDLLNAADVIEQTGGAGPGVEEVTIPATDEFVRSVGIRVIPRS